MDASAPGNLVELSIAFMENANTRPLLDGRVRPEGVRLVPSVVHASELFWRQLKFSEFDASEMSLSSLFIAVSKGETNWVAIPVFTMRKFFHTGIIVRTASGVEKPADLKGKRVGVPEYQQTSALWSRGILEHEFGVRARDIEWFMERGPDKSHGGATAFKPPPGVRINQIPPNTDIGQMLVAGELDATLLYITDPNLVDRSRIDLMKTPGFRLLFPDQAAERRRYFASTGIYPINHTMVIRRSVLERHPWIALNLYSAFLRARDSARQAAFEYLQAYIDAGVLDDGVARKALDSDVMPYGVKAARKVLDTISQYVHEQGLTLRRVGVEELFAPSTLDV